MSEPTGPLWTLPALLAAMGLLAWFAAALDAALVARAAGRPVGAAIVVEPVREGLRLLFTQRTATTLPEANSWRLGTATVLVAPVVASVAIPLASGLAVSDLLVGAIWWYALHTLVWVGVHLAGYQVNSHYPLVGAHRYLGQVFSYTMGLSILLLVVATPARSFRISELVATQEAVWYAVWAPAALLMHLLFVLAFAFWGPFATPIATDLGGGVAAELSGVDRFVFFLGRYFALVSGAAITVPLFLGGHHGPWLPGTAWIAIKTLAVLALLVVVGRLVPRWPVDRFGEPAWIVLIPAALVQLFVVAGIALIVR